MLIIGLGNPGQKYDGTRHNIGFEVIDKLRVHFGLPEYIDRFSSEFIRGKYSGRPLMLMKPQTFMNLSGSSVQTAINFFKLDPKEDIIVVHDDLDLDVGRLRIRPSAGPGGHNGVKDIIDTLGTKDFFRFRIGIGKPEGRKPVEAHVLERFSKEDRKEMDLVIEKTVNALIVALAENTKEAMNRYSA